MAIEGERLRIAGLTGVDVRLEVAGPGSRSYAFLIDWHIRVLLALAWFAAAFLPARLTSDAPAHGRHFVLVAMLPAILIYLLYQPVMELALRGRSPGKRMAGVRLVTRSGGTPGVMALLIRNIFRIIDSLPSLYVVGLVFCFMTRQRVRIGDLAAGTLLIVDHGTPAAAWTPWHASSGQHELPLPLAELIHELLERWPALAPERRRALALQLIGRATRASSEAGATEPPGAADSPHPADPPLEQLTERQLCERLRRLIRHGGTLA